MITSKSLSIPRNATHQADGLLYGRVARMVSRITGIAIVVFVLTHVIAQAVLHVSAFSNLSAAAPWLPALTKQNWIHAVLMFCILFHTLYGLRLVVGDLGIRLNYRGSWWTIISISAAFAVRELLRYVGI
jgi:succinate dehydrogenase/fumarate reductase cytochrome b subunit